MLLWLLLGSIDEICMHSILFKAMILTAKWEEEKNCSLLFYSFHCFHSLVRFLVMMVVQSINWCLVAVACLYPKYEQFPFCSHCFGHTIAEPGHAIICVKSNTLKEKSERERENEKRNRTYMKCERQNYYYIYFINTMSQWNGYGIEMNKNTIRQSSN